MILRAATTADVAAIGELEAGVFGTDAWSPGMLAESLRADHVHVVVCEERGYVVVSVAGDVADLQRIAVHPGHRRSGVGSALLSAGLALARDGAADRVILEVGAGNRGALLFYAAAGFAEIDRRRGYYRDGTDAIVMRLLLAPAPDQD